MVQKLYGLLNPSLLLPYSGQRSVHHGISIGHKEIRFENLDFRIMGAQSTGGRSLAYLSDIVSDFLGGALGSPPFDVSGVKCLFFNCVFDVAIIGDDLPRITNVANGSDQEVSLWEMSFCHCVFEDVTISSLLAAGFLLFKDSKISLFVLEGEEERAVIPCRLQVLSCELGAVRAAKASIEKKVFFVDSFMGTNSREIDFSGVRFASSVSFKGSHFDAAPKFFGAELPQDIEFQGVFFRDVSSLGAWRAYRCLKHHMSGFSSDHEVQLFHALELEARYNTELPKGWLRVLGDAKGVETITSWLMRGLNNYGRHLWLPLIWLLYISCWFLVLYAAMGGVGYFPAEGKSIAGWIENAGQHYSNVTFAARNLFGPFGLILSADEIQPNNMTVKTLGVAHFIISSVIWFIWILQIRSRFKL